MQRQCLFCPKTPGPESTQIIYESYTTVKSLTLKPNGTFQNRFGVFKCDDIIGNPAGTKLLNNKNTGFVYSLNPTSELWTKALSHRTQILYRADISAIIANLDIKPNSVVVESGTGSGSLSVAILRSIMPTGKLFTYEFNQERAELANAEFSALGLGLYVRCVWRDVLQGGFKHDELDTADCVFLDLPKPWEAVTHAFEVLKPQGRICAFSPCIEQVQRTCAKLREMGVSEVRTIETLLRPLHAKGRASGGGSSIHHLHDLEKMHTGYLSFAVKP